MNIDSLKTVINNLLNYNKKVNNGIYNNNKFIKL